MLTRQLLSGCRSTITRTVNTSILTLERTWFCKTFSGSWDGDMTGGCKNEPDWLEHNPQFVFTQRSTSTVHIALLQRGHDEFDKLKVIGFTVFQIEENRQYRLVKRHKVMPEDSLTELPPGDGTEFATSTQGARKRFIKKLFRSEDPEVRRSGVRGCKSRYMNAREVTTSARLRAGRYMIVPTTFKKGEVGDFLIRIYHDDIQKQGWEARSVETRYKKRSGCLGLCLRPPQQHCGVLRVTVLSAANLPSRLDGSLPDPYAVLEAEGGATVRCQVIPLYFFTESDLSYHVSTS